MADRTHIEWTDATWNPIVGCTRVSEGCRNCYAEVMAARFNQPGQWGEGLARTVDTADGKDHRWTGAVERRDHRTLITPIFWKKPRKVFVCSTSDLFHERVPDAWIDEVFAVMALSPRHTFQVLTKRPERARDYLSRVFATHQIANAALRIGQAANEDHAEQLVRRAWPLPNVWLGTSVEDQPTADARVPLLLGTPAALHWVSYEPALGPVDWRQIRLPGELHGQTHDALSGYSSDTPWGLIANKLPDPFSRGRLGWIVMGGESGPGARPMHPDWARQTRDQCAPAGVPFLFKQWGGCLPGLLPRLNDGYENIIEWQDGTEEFYGEHQDIAYGENWLTTDERGLTLFCRAGKSRAGRLLDGVLHDAYPEPRP